MWYIITVFSVLIICVIYAFIKYKYGFWIYQPVYHAYDLTYYVCSNQIIDNELPIKNKYVNLNIKTKILEDITEVDWSMFILFIQKYFLKNKDNVYNPKLDNVLPYFKNSSKSMVSFYYEDIYYTNIDKNNDVFKDNNLCSIISLYSGIIVSPI